MSIETSKTFNTTNLTDEQFSHLLDKGVTVNDIERFVAVIEYRREYNSRPHVRAKRAMYNAARNERMKVIKNLLK
jgi:hypothetical protein